MLTPDLLSLTLPVRALRPGPLPPVGRAMQAILINAAQEASPALPDLHAGSDLRPFTTSDLAGHNRRGRLLPRDVYALRFTALNAPLAAALMESARAGQLRPGATLVFTNAEFVLVDEAVAPREAITTSYHNLALANQERMPAPEISLWLASPTSFKREGKSLPVPLPELVFGSLMRKWNAFCPAPLRLPEALGAYAAQVAISRYTLQTHALPAKGDGVKIGATGHVTYTDLGGDPNLRAALRLLADFAPYAGVGAHTTIGMGQCFAEE